MGKRQAVFPAGRQDLYTRNKYSPAISSGGFLFVSGQVGSREDGSPEPDPEAQLRLAFTHLNAVLAAGGCTFDDIVDFTLYVVGEGIEKKTGDFAAEVAAQVAAAKGG